MVVSSLRRLEHSALIRRLVLALLVLLLFATAGCPLLMVGSLGYEGYEYDKTGHLPGMPPSQSSGASHAQATPSHN
jgi:Zn-dependent protease